MKTISAPFIALLLLLFFSSGPQTASAQSWVWGKAGTVEGCDAYPVATDPSGNVFCAGLRLPFYGSGSIDFGSGVSTPGALGEYQSVWVKYDNTGTPLWADGTLSGDTWINSIASDAGGNLILFGSFQSATMRIGSFTLTNAYPSGTGQYFLAKVSPTGTVLWAINDGNILCGPVTIFGPYILGEGGVATDAGGNIYISSSYNLASMTIGPYTLTNSGGAGTYDVFVAKYSPSGSVIWASSIGGTADDYSLGLTLSPAGNVYICGAFSSSSVTIGPSVISDPSSNPVAYIAKFSPAGAPLWGQAAVSPNGSFALGIASDNSGNIYMTGGFKDAAISFGSSTITRTFPTSVPAQAEYLVQYSSADVVVWSKTIGANSTVGGTWGWSIALAPCGQIWVSGNYDHDVDIDGNTLAVVPGWSDPVFLAGYNLGGGVVSYTGLASGGDDQNGIACDGNGNVFLCSDYEASPFSIGSTAMPPVVDPESFYLAKWGNATNDTTYTHQDTVIACAGVTTETLTAPAGYSTYYWDDGSILRTRTISAAGTYWVYDVTCGLPVLIDTFHVTTVVADTTYDHRDTTLCAVSSLILLAPPGYPSYMWNTGSTAAFLAVAGSGTYFVNCINGCTLFADTFHVTFLPLPVVNLGNDTNFCLGNTLTLASVQPPGNTYLWSTGSTGTSITVSATGSYWLQITGADLCLATDTIHVIVSPTVTVDLGPDTTNCTASPITLQSSFTYTAPNYLWSDGSITPSIVASVTGTYWLQVTDAGCSGADTVNVTILYDTFSLANHDTAICFGQEVPVFLNVNPAATCQWLPTAGIAISTIPSPAIGPDTSAEYRVTISLAGCPDIVDSFYIDVQPNPSVFAGGNKIVCQYDTLHFNSFVNPAWYTHYSYSWSPSTFLDDPTMPTVVFTAGTNTEYVLTVTTPAGCHSNDSVFVTVHPGDFAKLDTTFGICPHDSVQLIPSGGVSYVWHPGLYLSDSTSSAPWSHAITSLAYTAIATSSFGCLDTVYTNVVIHPSAVIYLGDSVTLYPGESYQISPQTNCVNFTWFPAAGLNNDNVSNPLATPLISTKYIVNASTEWGCKAEDSISIYFDQSSLLAIPNAFTPGAGINNKLFIIRRGEATLNYYRIYNRWGNLVFETSDIDEGWDGTYKGKPQPFDVYVYEIEAETSIGSVFKKHGNVTLIR